MKIAFVDHISVGGGIIRYATNLAKALCELDQDVSLVFFTTEYNYNTNQSLFDSQSQFFTTKILKNSKKTILGNMLVDVFYYRLFRTSRSKLLPKEIFERTKDFDLVYFTCAHATEYVHVSPPSFATFHDLNWKFLFGTPLFPKKYAGDFENQIKKWFAKTHIIVSTPFIKRQIEHFFPDINKEIDIIFLPNLSKKVENNIEKRDQVLSRLGISKKYILYPAHLMPHKNHNNLFNAFYRFTKSVSGANEYILVLSGGATDHFNYGKVTSVGLEFATPDDFNVLGLGYVSNEEIDILIKNATLIISASLYEAGSGPALDAWINQVPVIMSNIDSHLDQMRHFEIECNLFDPMNPIEMSSQIENALSNIHLLKEQSIKASKKFDDYSWKVAGKYYLEVFKKNLKHEY